MRRDERFEVQRTIQDGMVATSYKARDRVLDRTVLLKVLHPRRASDQDMVERFRREAMLQARLKHPNIVTVYDFGTDEDMFIASEFIDGDTLDSILRQEGRLSVGAPRAPDAAGGAGPGVRPRPRRRPPGPETGQHHG